MERLMGEKIVVFQRQPYIIKFTEFEDCMQRKHIHPSIKAIDYFLKKELKDTTTFYESSINIVEKQIRKENARIKYLKHLAKLKDLKNISL